ncbi:hypothetical protein ADU37_CDS09140 [Thermococcus sp. 2319x1]|uniref:hypothetical protein n=1 Tax=Thermococcus sp. 2319x1 TaxID=1674923 RepID=UPI00073AB8B4|nr:hypothetical protein [Thermococcus sp. 2319x1]ALV62613.1 hypothetical protein ADU37_CDS09140 [Thermococcus sp. 2319x1]
MKKVFAVLIGLLIVGGIANIVSARNSMENPIEPNDYVALGHDKGSNIRDMDT